MGLDSCSDLKRIKVLSFLPPLSGKACYITWLILTLKNGSARRCPLSLWKVGLWMCAHHSVMSDSIRLSELTATLINISNNQKGIFFFYPWLIFFSFFFFFFLICSEFCHTLKWNSLEFTCLPHPDPPSHFPLHPQKGILWTQSPRGCKQGTEASTAISPTSLCCWPHETNFILERKGQK